MAELQVVRADIFTLSADAIVNPVNCMGVMGAGLAAEFKRRYPMMFLDYERACLAGELIPGKLHTYWADQRWIVNFPTKNEHNKPSKLEYIASGLSALITLVRSRALESVAVPALGCGLGGLRLEDVQPMIRFMAKQLTDVEVKLVLK